MKTLWIIVGSIFTTILIAGGVCLLAINVKSGTITLVKVDNVKQLQLITNGNPPDIIFTSLKDTSFGDNIKVLKTNTHPIFSEVSDSIKDPIHVSLKTPDEHISNWLKQNGITEMAYNESTYKLTTKIEDGK
jgi:hypothetical protein